MTRFESIVSKYGLRPIMITGRAGTGKTTATKRLVEELNIKAYFLDNCVFGFYEKFRDKMKELTGTYPDFECPNFDLVNFHAECVGKDAETYINVITELREYMMEQFCDELERTYGTARQSGTGMTTLALAYEPAPRKTFLMDCFTPGFDILKTCKKIYRLLSPEQLTANAVGKRENLSGEKLERLMNSVNLATDMTLNTDLLGMEFVDIENDHTQECMDNIVARIASDLRPIF